MEVKCKYWIFPTDFLKRIWGLYIHSKAKPKWRFTGDTEWGNDETYIYIHVYSPDGRHDICIQPNVSLPDGYVEFIVEGGRMHGWCIVLGRMV